MITHPSIGPQLTDQTVVVLGGTSGIGLAVAKLVRAHGADVVLTGRDARRLEIAAGEVGATSSSSFDAYDHEALERFFDGLRDPIDHVFVAAGGPYYAPLDEIDLDDARRWLGRGVTLMVDLGRVVGPRLRTGGSLGFMSGTAARHPETGLTVVAAAIAATTAAAANLALEMAPARINLIAAGFVDTPLSAKLLGDGLEARRDQLRHDLPIRRVVVADDVAALAVHLMSNTALTGAVFDIDGGQQLLPSVGV